MDIDRRHLVLPAVAVALVGVAPALADTVKWPAAVTGEGGSKNSPLMIAGIGGVAPLTTIVTCPLISHI